VGGMSMYGIYIADSCRNIVMRNVTVKDSPEGIYFGYGGIENIQILNSDVSGELDYGGAIVFNRDCNARNITIANSKIFTPTKYWASPIYIYPNKIRDLLVENNTITGFYSLTLYCRSPSSDITIKDNRISPGTFYGISFWSSTHDINNITIANNTINARYKGILFWACINLNNVYIANNSIENSYTGIDLCDEGGKNVHVEHNLIQKTTTGLDLSEDKGVYINQNTIHDTTTAIKLESCNPSTITNNTIYNTSTAIYASGHGGHKISNNTIYNTIEAIYLNSAGGGTKISNNTIYNTYQYIESVNSWLNTTFTNNLIGLNRSTLFPLSINSFHGDFALQSVHSPPPPPSNHSYLPNRCIKIVNYTRAWINVTFPFSNSDISSSRTDMKTISVWEYHTSWRKLNSTLKEHRVSANITNFSLFAVLGLNDTTPPVVTFVPPTPANNTTLRTNQITVNVTSNEVLSRAILDWSGVNYTMEGSSTSWHITITSPNGVYHYRVYATDLAGNTNSTEVRVLTVAHYGGRGSGGGGGSGGGSGGSGRGGGNTHIHTNPHSHLSPRIMTFSVNSPKTALAGSEFTVEVEFSTNTYGVKSSISVSPPPGWSVEVSSSTSNGFGGKTKLIVHVPKNASGSYTLAVHLKTPFCTEERDFNVHVKSGNQKPSTPASTPSPTSSPAHSPASSSTPSPASSPTPSQSTTSTRSTAVQPTTTKHRKTPGFEVLLAILSLLLALRRRL